MSGTDWMIGTELHGRYRVLSKLGEGGMGEVYLAEHLLLGRKEALKILRPRVADTPQLVARFRREARAANRVQHPNIISVYDFGQLPDGRFFLAMEYADGDPVNDLLRRIGPLSIRRTLHVLAQLADAADHAHGLGVIHRDLKPHNMILVEHRGQNDVLKVVDFGVAKIIAPEYDDSVGVTRQGTFYGTPAYMAPELFQGPCTDPRSDLYSIGCIAMELLTGDPPFLGNLVQLMAEHVATAPTPPSQRRRGDIVPPALDRIVLRCLDKDPERRFASGRELAEALRSVPGYGEERTPPGRQSYPVITSPFPRVPKPGDFEEGGSDIRTSEKDHHTNVAGDEAGALADTQARDTGEARRALYQTVRVLAEAMVDQGVSGVQLSIAVSTVAELESQISELTGEMLSIELHENDLERRAREREASLRFAIGELRFEREQAQARGEPGDEELRFQIEELESRLAEVGEDLVRELATSTDKGISLAATIADREERLSKRYEALTRIVDQLYRPTDELRPLHDRVRAAREMLELALLVGVQR
jgi:serine/threonine protein kinase